MHMREREKLKEKKRCSKTKASCSARSIETQTRTAVCKEEQKRAVRVHRELGRDFFSFHLHYQTIKKIKERQRNKVVG